MSGIDSKPSHSEGALPAALRRLARSAPHSGPPELGTGLAKAFRRHHFRRRVIRSGAVCGIVLAVAAALLLMSANHINQPGMSRGQPAAAGQANVSVSVQREDKSSEEEADQTFKNRRVAKHARSARRVRADARSAAATSDSVPTLSAATTQERFVALPSFAFRVPGEELRIIRVSMPVSSLRLLGVQVHGEFSSRRITTDLVIGTDGTPYAFRPIT